MPSGGATFCRREATLRIQIAVPESHVTKPVLDGALEAVTRLNEQLIKSGVSPTDQQLIAQGAKWKPEPPGQEHFDHGAAIASRGWGDCDDWAPLRAARLRVTGEDPGAIAEVRKTGMKRWHATVTRSDGSEDDPSLDAGMPGPARAVGVSGAWQPAMRRRIHGVDGTYIATPHLAMRPIQDRGGEIESWQARADLPWHWQPGNTPSDLAMVTLHRSPVADQAIAGAVRGAFDLGAAGGFAEPEHLARMECLADALDGVPWEELAERYGEAEATVAGVVVGGFFGKALKGLGKMAKGGLKFVTKNPLGKLAMSAIPGASLATQAFNMASPMLQKNLLKQGHKPPAERTDSPVKVAVPVGPSAGAPPPRAGEELNVQLLTRFGDLIADAYKTTHSSRVAASRPARAAAPRRATRAHPVRRHPGTAWPK